MASPTRRASRPSRTTSSDHVSVGTPREAAELDAELAARVDDDALDEVLAEVPDEWLEPRPGAESPDELRAAYRTFLRARLDGTRAWVPGRPAA